MFLDTLSKLAATNKRFAITYMILKEKEKSYGRILGNDMIMERNVFTRTEQGTTTKQIIQTPKELNQILDRYFQLSLG